MATVSARDGQLGGARQATSAGSSTPARWRRTRGTFAVSFTNRIPAQFGRSSCGPRDSSPGRRLILPGVPTARWQKRGCGQKCHLLLQMLNSRDSFKIILKIFFFIHEVVILDFGFLELGNSVHFYFFRQLKYFQMHFVPYHI